MHANLFRMPKGGICQTDKACTGARENYREVRPMSGSSLELRGVRVLAVPARVLNCEPVKMPSILSALLPSIAQPSF